jgi:TPR repeat protein
MKTQLKLLTTSLLLLSASVAASSIASVETQNTPHQVKPSECNETECVEGLNQLKRFAQHGHALAATIVAMAYSDGVGFDKNPTIALKMLKKGAAKNEPIALYQLSAWYRDGINVEKNQRNADLYLDRAVKLNYPPAMHAKASMLFVIQDTESQQAAIDLLHKAAGYGYQESQYVLAQLLQNEQSSAENLIHAAEFLRRLTLQSYKDADVQLKTLIGKLTETQQATAEELAYFNETFNIEVMHVGQSNTLSQEIAILNDRIAFTQFGRYSGVSTGSRIPGKLCGEGSSNCSSFRPDDLDWLMMGTSLAPK